MNMLMYITSKWLEPCYFLLLTEPPNDERTNISLFCRIKINMLPLGKSLSPTVSPSNGPHSQGLRRTPMTSPLSSYHHGGSILRSPASNNPQSPGTLPTIISPERSPASQAPSRSSPNSTQVSSHFVSMRVI